MDDSRRNGLKSGQCSDAVVGRQSDTVPSLAAALEQSQSEIEDEKTELVRTLHDDLGGLLVGAIMDMGWVAIQASLPIALKEKVLRAQGLMRAAIDLKRELIESIRPTLLDNVGLYSTMRWHMKARCTALSLPYAESFPDAEGDFSSEIRTGVFRIFEAALKKVLSEMNPADLSLQVKVINDVLHCHLTHQSMGRLVDEAQNQSTDTSMHHRAEHVDGTVRWSTTAAGQHMHLQVPLIAH